MSGKRYRICVDTDLCQGHSVCVSEAPELFRVTDQGQLYDTVDPMVPEINEDQLKVKVLVNIFGRETPVELEFAQVARL